MARPDMSYGPPPRAAGLLGQARPQTPTHVRVPISTLVSLLLAEAPKPVMPRSQPMQRPAPAAMGQLGMQRPQMQSPLPTVSSFSNTFAQRRRTPTVSSLSSMFAQRRRAPTLGRYTNF
jgi:hypothetical protein